MDMSPAQKRMVDTLYARVTPDLRNELDSVCDTRFEIEMQALVDSLLEVRLKEKEALLNRQ